MLCTHDGDMHTQAAKLHRVCQSLPSCLYMPAILVVDTELAISRMLAAVAVTAVAYV